MSDQGIREEPISERHEPQETAALGRRFLTVWSGQTVSTIGSTVSGVGVAVHVYVTTGSAVWLGVFEALVMLPAILVLPGLGLVDRLDRRRVMLGADSLAVLGPVVALLLAWQGSLELWHLAGAAVLGGLGTAVQVPAYQAALPTLVIPAALGRANGLLQLAPAAGIVIGPAVATPLVAAWGVEAVLVVDVATFAVAFAATLSVRFGSRVEPLDPESLQWASAIRWLRGPGRALLFLLGTMALLNFVLTFWNVAVLTLATQLGGTARSGVALAAGGAAMVAGSLVVGRRGVGDRPIRTFVRCLSVFAAGTAVTAVRPSFALVVVGVVVGLVAVPPLSAATATLFHSLVPPEMHGRVFGVRSAVAQMLGPVGAVTAGVVITHLAAPTMAPDGLGGQVVGPLIGAGDGRGPALVMLAVAAAVAVLAAAMRRSRTLAVLDDATAEHLDPAAGDDAPDESPDVSRAVRPTEVGTTV